MNTKDINIWQISKSNIYFTGDEDIVRCFHCDIGLAEWNQSDDPWVEHARHSPKCPFLRERKPQHFIDDVQNAWSRVSRYFPLSLRLLFG